jgi:anti-anti-sigma regulatory factor
LVTPEVQFSINKPVSPETLQGLRTDVVTAIDGGAESITIDVDDVGVLDSPLIAALISILREAREHGVTVSLHATRKSILETLHITALEKVFRIVSTDAPIPPAPPPPRPQSPMRRRVTGRAAAIVAGTFFALGSLFGSAASGETELSTSDVMAHVVAQNAGMQTYSAHVRIGVALRSFPYLSERFEGTTYYKRPDNFEVVFDHVPSYAKGFDRIYTGSGDPVFWERHFNVTPAGDREVAGHRDLVLRLVQKVRGMIDHEDVAIDPATWHVDEIDWYYYNGGTIAMSQSYEDVGGYSVLAEQHATIRIPFVHAAADAVYDDYKTNVSIDDSVFAGKKD